MGATSFLWLHRKSSFQQNKMYSSLKFHSIVVAGKVNRLSGKIKRWLFNSGFVIRVRVLYKPSSIHIFVIISLYLIILFIYVFHVKFGESWLENLMIACLVCSSRALFLPLYCNQPTRLSRKKKKYESVCVCRTYDWASYIAGKRQKKYILENLHIRQSFSFLDTVYSSTHRDTSSIYFFSLQHRRVSGRFVCGRVVLIRRFLTTSYQWKFHSLAVVKHLNDKSGNTKLN